MRLHRTLEGAVRLGVVLHNFKRACRGLGIAERHFHDVRQTCAMLLLSANVKAVSKMFEHSSIAITLDIYSYDLPDVQSDAAAIMGHRCLIDQ